MNNKDNSFEEIWNKIKELKKVVISLHKGPDGDSLGSCAALKYVLERDLGIKVTLISPDNLDETLTKLDIAKEVIFEKSIDDLNLTEFDALITLDFGSLEGFSKKNKLEDIFIINLDHHSSNNYFGNLNYVDSTKGSTCSVLIYLFKKWKIMFDKELSQRLLLGVCTDSGFFTNSNAEDSLKNIPYLLEKGANYLKIVNQIIGNTPLKLKKYYAFLINNLHIDKKGKFGYVLIHQEKIKELDLNLSEIRLGIGEIKNIKELDFVFTLAEVDGRIKGSFRTNKNVDVLEFAKKLGGGGHKKAAAFYLEKLSLEEACKRVLEVLTK